MKIVFVSDAIYPYNKGGKEKRLFELSTRLAKLGHDVHIYTMHWWPTYEKIRTENGVHLHAISKYHPMYHGDRRSIKEGIMFGLACFRLFRVEFDVIDVDHMPFFPIISCWIVCTITRRQRKFHATWHEALSRKDWTTYMGVGGNVAALIERICIRLPHTITVSSAHTKRLIPVVLGRNRNLEFIPPGLDYKFMQAIEPASIRCDVLYVGRLVKDKNVDKLIHAMAIVTEKRPRVRCVIIGHGIEKPALEKLINKLDLHKQVTIMNPLPESKDIYAFMKRAKVFVLPSTREGFGIVALEALGCGTPVITINAPANAAKNLIKDGEIGSIVKLSATPIAKAIETWLATKPKTSIAAHAAPYAWDTLAVKQAEVYAS